MAEILCPAFIAILFSFGTSTLKIFSLDCHEPVHLTGSDCAMVRGVKHLLIAADDEHEVMQSDLANTASSELDHMTLSSLHLQNACKQRC